MKILVWDIETFPLLVNSWSLYVQNGYINHENIERESGLLCAAWKWVGEKRIYAAANHPNDPLNDKDVVTAMHEVLSSADVVVAHNGDAFDMKKFNARAIFHGLPPIPPVYQIDTKKVAKRYFSFNSNRLAYLGEFLGLGAKLDTGGFGLWKAAMNGDAKAFEKMLRYNRQDVALLEKVYLKLRPYIRNHPVDSRGKCESCGSKHVTGQGVRTSKRGPYQRLQCQKCGHWQVGEKVA